MCLLIHKPAHVEVPAALLDSAVDFNPHGFGIMTFGKERELIIRRRSASKKSELHRIYAEFRTQECVIHLRYGTSGKVDCTNTHPIRITKDIYMAHNGTVNMDRHLQDRSDTWHLVHDYLRPVLKRRPELLHDRFFQELVMTWCGPHNKFVFMDAVSGKTVIVNREKGFEIDGLWLSNTRWFDASRFAWHQSSADSKVPRGTALFSI
ncbi:MAG: class II glutamine amidotransferase [Pseudomonadota bacterium]